MTNKELRNRSLIFVEQSPGGALAKTIRELLKKLEPTLGFGIKVVERSGQALGSKFPLANLWDGIPCGRMDCTTCGQGVEEIPPCSRPNLVYENVCAPCNPDASKKGAMEKVKDDIPTIYVGETGRSIYERAREH